MAGHSKFKNIMHRKGAQDKKRAQIFAKLSKELSVAAREGADHEFNPRLRAAVAAAKSQNMPNDNIKRAIERAARGEADNYEEVRYEGYGPGGVAVIIESLTDNRNRTAAELRSAFSKHGGNLAETGSVAFMFYRSGIIIYPILVASSDQVFDAAIEAGADDIVSSDQHHTITCEPDNLAKVCTILAKHLGQPETFSIAWKAHNKITIDDGNAHTVANLIKALEDSDDVQTVVTNVDVVNQF